MSTYSRQTHAVLEAASGDLRPLAWALLGVHHGDNEQVLALAHNLGCRVEERRLDFNAMYRLPNMWLGATLATLTTASARQLAPPWPDLVIGAGRRTVPAALWVRRQSGGRTRLIRIGRPRAPLALFDAVITTPQFLLPALPNVVHQLLPFGFKREVRTVERERWRREFGNLPRPWTAVLVGGFARPFAFDDGAARRLAECINTYHARHGGSALITTSPRTRPEAAGILKAGISAPHYMHAWCRGAPNPYSAILALADEIIVTADSVSMLADACRTGKPVAMFELARRRDLVSRIGLFCSRHLRANTTLGRALRLIVLNGFFSPPPEIAEVHDVLLKGMIVRSFDPGRRIPAGESRLQLDLTSRSALDRVRSVVGSVAASRAAEDSHEYARVRSDTGI